MKAHADSHRQQATHPPRPDSDSALPLRPQGQASNARPQVQQLDALQLMMNAGEHVRQLKALGALANGGGAVVQLMPADEIKIGRWYEIEGVEGPRYLKSRRFPAGEAPTWNFYSHSLGMAKGEEPLVIDKPERILQIVDEPPAIAAEAFGKGASDSRIFGLDGKDKASVLTAIETGYRAFDAAKTYGFTAAQLVQACTEAGLTRRDYKVVYKIGHEQTAESLSTVIKEALDALGYIDVLMVHEAGGDLAGKIAAINQYVDRGKVKAGGLSNVGSDRIEGMSAHDLRNMVVTQDSVKDIKPEKQLGIGLRAGGRLEELGNKVSQSVYGLNSDIRFTDEERRQLEALHVSESQARMIWAAQRGFAVVSSSSNPDRIRSNFEPPPVTEDVAAAVAELVDANLARPEAPEEEAEEWKYPLLGEIHRAAKRNAETNDLGAFLHELQTLVQGAKGSQRRLKLMSLKLTSGKAEVQAVYSGITWDSLLQGHQNVLQTCNAKDFLNDVAAAVKRINEGL